jgi:hypothetical protein
MGWDWDALMSAPDTLVDEIIKMLNQQAEDAELKRLMDI